MSNFFMLQEAAYRAERELSAAQSRLEAQQALLAEKAAALADAVERQQVGAAQFIWAFLFLLLFCVISVICPVQ